MKNYSILICPKCKSELERKDNSLLCKNNHCYDFAKQGYVNLLLVNQKNSKNPGDDETMINARDLFLKEGYFSKLKDEITKQIVGSNLTILDAGCGSGYYSFGLENFGDLYLTDISKIAVKKASVNKNAISFVSSIFELPIKDKMIDYILNIFAPKPQSEFLRILKSGGKIIEVVPGKNHLKELKNVLFKENIRENQEKFAYNNFILEKSQKLTYKTTLKNNNDIMNLSKMTPYWYKGAEKIKNTLKNINNMEITFDFIINIWSIKM